MKFLLEWWKIFQEQVQRMCEIFSNTRREIPYLQASTNHKPDMHAMQTYFI